MVKYTHRMQQCLNEIQEEVLLNYEEIEVGKVFTAKRNPTKKKEFLGVAIKLNKPMFQFYINEHFVGTYSYNKDLKKWKLVD